MILYRICNKKELDLIKEKDDFSEIGTSGSDLIRYQKQNDMNTHMYDINKNYMHFFVDKGNVLYMNSILGNYICTYDIPNSILEGKLGIGRYSSYFYNRDIIGIAEYSIESSKIKKEYLQKVEMITSDMCITDDDYPDSLDEFLETIYTNNDLDKEVSGTQRKLVPNNQK